MKEKLLAQKTFTLYVQLKESTSTYGRLISVANWKTCEIGWISPTPTQNSFIESVTTKDGVRISKLNILVPDKYLNEDVAPPSSVKSPAKPKKKPLLSSSNSQLSPGRTFRDALIVQDKEDISVDGKDEEKDDKVNKEKQGEQSTGEQGGQAIKDKEEGDDQEREEKRGDEIKDKEEDKNKKQSDEDGVREEEKEEEGEGHVDDKDGWRGEGEEGGEGQGLGLGEREEHDDDEDGWRGEEEGEGQGQGQGEGEGEEHDDDEDGWRGEEEEEGYDDEEEEEEENEGKVGNVDRAEWLQQELGDKKDEEAVNQKLHGFLGFPDPTSGILPPLLYHDKLGPYGDDYVAFRDDLERLYGDGFLVSLFIKTINKSFNLDPKSDPPALLSKTRRELTSTSNARVWETLGDPNDVTSVEFANRFKKLFPFTKNGKFTFKNDEFILGNWTIINFYKRVKDEYIDKYTEGNGPGSELYQTVANLLDKLCIDMSLGRDLLSIDWNGKPSSSSSSSSSSGQTQSTAASRKKDEATPNESNRETSAPAPESTVSNNTHCGERCLGRCSDSSASCMFLCNLLPPTQDAVGSNFNKLVRESFKMKTDVVFIEDQTYLPLVATNKKQCFWITPSRPEYIYTERVGSDVMTWQEGNVIKCIFAGQLYRSKVRGKGMVMVIKILRGKCRDNKIRLLTAEYEVEKGFVSRYVNGSQSHIDFLNQHTPTDHFASPEVITKCLLEYHEQTSALFSAFDAMGGLVETDPRWPSYRLGSRKVQLSDEQFKELMATAFQGEEEDQWGQALHRDDIYHMTLIAPHQYNTEIAKLALTRQKNNSALNVHSSERTLQNICQYLMLYYILSLSFHELTFYYFSNY